jgi:hypothetical protein
MTLDELKAKRNRLLKTVGISRQEIGDQSVAYTGDWAKELAILDAEIAKMEAQETGRARIRQIRMQSSTGLD